MSAVATRTVRALFRDHPDLGLCLSLGGIEAVCRPSGALWVEAWGALIVADLHLEKGSAYARRGQMLPPYDTAETLRRLEAEAAALRPRVLVFLGDTFHDRSAEGRLASGDAERLRALAKGRALLWVTGNHDPQGPRNLPGDSLPTWMAGGLVFVHEPGEGARAGSVERAIEIAGHLHPCAKVRAGGGAVRRRCFVTDGERLILPAFGALAGGLNVRDPAFRALFRPRPTAAVLGAARVHAVGWGSLDDD